MSQGQGQYNNYGQPVNQPAFVTPNQGGNYGPTSYGSGYQQRQRTFIDSNVDVALSQATNAIGECVNRLRFLDGTEARPMGDYLYNDPSAYDALYDYFGNAHGNVEVAFPYIYDTLINFIRDTANAWRTENIRLQRQAQYNNAGYGRAATHAPTRYGSPGVSNHAHPGGVVHNVGRSSCPRLNRNNPKSNTATVLPSDTNNGRVPTYSHPPQPQQRQDSRTMERSNMHHPHNSGNADPYVSDARNLPTQHTPMEPQFVDFDGYDDDIVVVEPRYYDTDLACSPNEILTTTVKERIGNMPVNYIPSSEYKLANDTDTMYVSVGKVDSVENIMYVPSQRIMEDVPVASFAMDDSVDGDVAAVVDVGELEILNVPYVEGATLMDDLVEIYNHSDNNTLSAKVSAVIDELNRNYERGTNANAARIIATMLVDDFNEAACVNFVALDKDGLDRVSASNLADIIALIDYHDDRYKGWRANMDAFKVSLARCIHASFTRMFTSKRKHYIEDIESKDALVKIILESHGTFRVLHTDESGDKHHIDTKYLVANGISDEILPRIVEWARKRFPLIRHRKVCLTDIEVPANTYSDVSGSKTPFIGDDKTLPVKMLRNLVTKHGSMRLVCIRDTSTYVSPVLLGVGYDNKIFTRRL